MLVVYIHYGVWYLLRCRSAGATRDFEDTGAVYLWEEDAVGGWTATTIKPSVADPKAAFGYDVALAATDVIVAAPDLLDARGGVYVFDPACGDHDTLAAIGSLGSGCRDVAGP